MYQTIDPGCRIDRRGGEREGCPLPLGAALDLDVFFANVATDCLLFDIVFGETDALRSHSARRNEVAFARSISEYGAMPSRLTSRS